MGQVVVTASTTNQESGVKDFEVQMPTADDNEETEDDNGQSIMEQVLEKLGCGGLPSCTQMNAILMAIIVVLLIVAIVVPVLLTQTSGETSTPPPIMTTPPPTTCPPMPSPTAGPTACPRQELMDFLSSESSDEAPHS